MKLTLGGIALAVSEGHLKNQAVQLFERSGLPLKAYVSLSPTVHLFGDTIRARVDVLTDSRLVDPSSIRVHGGFLPYQAVASPTLGRRRVGRLTQLTWTWSLRCLDVRCVPIDRRQGRNAPKLRLPDGPDRRGRG